jgi:hypothetical protein
MVKSLLIEDIIYRNWDGNKNAKCYMVRGEMCNICFDSINTKREAYLSSCGHSFHLSCIYEYQYVKENSYNDDCIFCPVCRQDLGLWSLEFTKYWMCNNDSKYTIKLDDLENFWMFIDINQPCYDNCPCGKLLIGTERFILNRCGHKNTCASCQHLYCSLECKYR